MLRVRLKSVQVRELKNRCSDVLLQPSTCSLQLPCSVVSFCPSTTTATQAMACPGHQKTRQDSRPTPVRLQLYSNSSPATLEHSRVPSAGVSDPGSARLGRQLPATSSYSPGNADQAHNRPAAFQEKANTTQRERLLPRHRRPRERLALRLSPRGAGSKLGSHS